MSYRYTPHAGAHFLSEEAENFNEINETSPERISSG